MKIAAHAMHQQRVARLMHPLNFVFPPSGSNSTLEMMRNGKKKHTSLGVIGPLFWQAVIWKRVLYMQPSEFRWGKRFWNVNYYPAWQSFSDRVLCSDPSEHMTAAVSDSNSTGRLLARRTVCVWTVASRRSSLSAPHADVYQLWQQLLLWLAGYEAICQDSWQLRLEIPQ